jgi:hypothetical protein
MARLLADRDFDVAGVQAEEGGPVIGFVERNRLVSGIVRDHLEPLSAEHLISDGTALPTALAVLRAKPRVFVLIGSKVKGIATRTDLNKPPVRIYLFSLVSLLEMHLAFWVRAAYPDDIWRTQISPARVEAAVKVQKERQMVGQTSELVDCLQMGDKRDLLLKQEDLCRELGLTSKKEAQRSLKKAESLRNLLAHGQQNLVQGSSWSELFTLAEWLETIVHTSDNLVEQRASAAAQQGLAALWSSA